MAKKKKKRPRPSRSKAFAKTNKPKSTNAAAAINAQIRQASQAAAEAPTTNKKNKRKGISGSVARCPHPLLDETECATVDSRVLATRAFEWMISPVPAAHFNSKYREKKALYIPRHPDSKIKWKKQRALERAAEEAANRDNVKEAATSDVHEGEGDEGDVEEVVEETVGEEGEAQTKKKRKTKGLGWAVDESTQKHYYKGVFGKEDVEALLDSTDHEIIYGKDIDVTSYKHNTRETHNPKGKASSDYIWQKYADGCSIRFLCPQRFVRPLWKLLNLLDDYWGGGAGANTYLTPGGTQGFAPHYDDVDIFILQTEGAKRWRLYHPPDESHRLAEYSSPNFKQSEIGEPYMDVILRQGDFLYAPRGTIHQCVAVGDQHSMHVTVSTNYRNSWASYLRTLLPSAVNIAASEDVELRKALPVNFHEYMGIMHSDLPNAKREKFGRILHSLVDRVLEKLPVDAACDEHALAFMHGRVPPCLAQTERPFNVMSAKRKQQQLSLVRLTSFVRLVRRGVCRLALNDSTEEDDASCTLYHIIDNSRLYKENELGSIQLPLPYAEAIEAIVHHYPRPLRVGELPIPDEDSDGPGSDSESEAESSANQRRSQLDLAKRLLSCGILVLAVDPDKPLD